jgi:hypothetical protein
MAEKTIKRRLRDTGDAAALASGDSPIFSTAAKLVEALKRSIPEGMQNAERRGHRAWGANCFAETQYKEERLECAGSS